MEFKYRAVDEKPPPPFTVQSSNYSYFADQAVRGPPSQVGPGFAHPNDYYQNPIAMREAMCRELEKERIREEIIADEIVRRRMLEAEVRREMMIERELAMRRGGNGLFYSSSSLSSSSYSMRYEPRGVPVPPLPHGVEGRFLQGKVPMSLEERLGMSAMQKQIGRFNSTPFQPQSSSELRISEVKPASEDISTKEKMVILDKPKANLAGAKRKAETPPAVATSELPSADAPKKVGNEEWSCALCQVSATSHQGLNQHLEGKKHKAREVALMNNGKNYSIGLYPKKIAKPSKLVETANNSSAKPGTKDLADSESAKKNNISLSKDKQLGNSVKKNKTVEGKQKQPKKFRFWCEMCQVGAFAEKIMEAHKVGKKHITKLQEVDQKSGAEVSTKIMQPAQKLNLAGEADKDGENTTTENADGVVDGVEPEAQQKEEPCADLNQVELESHQKEEAYADGGVDN